MNKTDIIIGKLRREKQELQSKIYLLSTFKGTDTWEKLGSEQAHLLDAQLDIMMCYNEILNLRILNLEKGE